MWDKALVYAQRAGDQAAAMYAPRAAAEHYGRALQAAAQLGVAAPMQLHRARGRAYKSLGEFAAPAPTTSRRWRVHVRAVIGARSGRLDRRWLLVGVARLRAYGRVLRAGARARACPGRCC